MASPPIKKITRISAPEGVRRIVETVLGCKWSLTALTLIQDGVNRPGQMVRSVEGLSPKVLNTCLSKLIEFNIVEKKSFPEIPPRVEYHVTEFGESFVKIFDVINDLEAQMPDQ